MRDEAAIGMLVHIDAADMVGLGTLLPELVVLNGGIFSGNDFTDSVGEITCVVEADIALVV